MIRTVIHINEELCSGCGLCASAEVAPIVRVFGRFIRGGALHRAHLHAGAAAHLLLARQMLLDRFLVERPH